MTGMAAVSRRWECGVEFGDAWLVCEAGRPVDLDGWLARRPDLEPCADGARQLADHATRVAAGLGSSETEELACVALLISPVEPDAFRYGMLRLSLAGMNMPGDPREVLGVLREQAQRDPAVFPGSWQGEVMPLEHGGAAVRSRMLDIGGPDDGVAAEDQLVYEVVEYLVPSGAPSGPGGGPVAQFVFFTPALDVGDALIEWADQVVGTFRWEAPA
jgi:hypothetical protein